MEVVVESIFSEMHCIYCFIDASCLSLSLSLPLSLLCLGCGLGAVCTIFESIFQDQIFFANVDSSMAEQRWDEWHDEEFIMKLYGSLFCIVFSI